MRQWAVGVRGRRIPARRGGLLAGLPNATAMRAAEARSRLPKQSRSAVACATRTSRLRVVIGEKLSRLKAIGVGRIAGGYMRAEENHF